MLDLSFRQCSVKVQSDRKKRVASIGPGLSFGEMALLDGGKRSADIVADERVICYGLAVEQLQELAAEHPNIMITILGNLTREFSERLRHANDEISALDREARPRRPPFAASCAALSTARAARSAPHRGRSA